MEFLNEAEYTKFVSYILNKIDKGPGHETQNEQLEELSVKLEQYIFEKIKANKYEMHYQPIFNPDKTVRGAEALFRMKNPLGDTNEKLKTINPEVAFYLLKQHGHETEVFYNQVSKICGDLNTNKILKLNPKFKVSINVPMNCLDENFVNHLKNELSKNNMSFSNIQVEILETEDFSKLAEHKEVITKLKSLGVYFAVDDFGTRNAKDLAVLDFMKFDVIKFAKELLDEAKQTKDFSRIKKTYDSITEKYPEAKILMEGVEGSKYSTDPNYISTETVVKKLKNIGTFLYQGYGFAKPQSASDLHTTIEQSGPNPPTSFGE